MWLDRWGLVHLGLEVLFSMTDNKSPTEMTYLQQTTNSHLDEWHDT